MSWSRELRALRLLCAHDEVLATALVHAGLRSAVALLELKGGLFGDRVSDIHDKSHHISVEFPEFGSRLVSGLWKGRELR